ncbi:hypothetical protein [Mastigocoleus sp. MO_188.B34]|nr:hypothetical protein [Mastigocoleus sp. MO_188.B34]
MTDKVFKLFCVKQVQGNNVYSLKNLALYSLISLGKLETKGRN